MNRKVFSTMPKAPTPDAVNEAGGVAYLRDPKEALEQYAMTACFNSTFYTSAEDHLKVVLDLCSKVNDPKFIGDLAIRSRTEGLMKDMPAFMCAWLAVNDPTNLGFHRAFVSAIDNVKQLSKFVTVIRSGVLGRKSLAHRISKAIEQWLNSRPTMDLWYQSIGVADPSLADIIRLAHPKPHGKAHAALFGYLSGRNKPEHAVAADELPVNLRAWLALQVSEDKEHMLEPTMRIPFQLLVGMEGADEKTWRRIAETASWAQARQSLNSFGKHGVFKYPSAVAHLAELLAFPPKHVMPYQIMTTYQNIEDDTPRVIVDALHTAMEAACENVPKLGNVLIGVDTSGSMGSAITGHRAGSTSKTRCVDVASLIACALLRTNRDAGLVAFDTRLHHPKLEPRDTVLTNAAKLAAYGGGGTDCSLPIKHALAGGDSSHDTIVIVSDNESWYDGGGQMAEDWVRYRGRNKKAQLICIDLTPNQTSQARSSPGDGVWNIGGFSDMVFALLGKIAKT